MARYPGNFTNSDILNVPRQLRTRPDTPMVELAYVTPQEQGILQALKPGTPHKGPMGIPNYDELDYLPPATSGGSWMNTPSGGEQQTQPQNVHQQAAQSMQQAGLSGVGDISSTTQEGQQAVKDYYEEREQETGQQMPQQIQDIISQTPIVQGIEVIPKAIKEKVIDPVISGVGNLWNQYMSGSLLTAPWKMLKYPKAKQFTMYGNQNDLAIIKSLLLNAEGELDPTKVDIYYEKYKDIINEGLKTDMKEVEEERGGTTSDEFWDKKFEEQGNLYFKKALASAPDKGAQGEESQRRLDKVSFYGGDDEDWVPPQTTGGLEQLAGEAIITGENLSPEEKAFNQKVFNARNELDRQTGGQGGGGGAGIPSLYTGPITTPDQTPDDIIIDDGFKPGVDPENPWGIPSPYAGFYDSPFNIPNPGASAAVVTPVTLPSGETINFGNPYIADQFQQYMASQTQTPATTQTPFDYSRWPQFGPAGGPVPNYVNQGLGQGPQFNYWNQIANAFPGMR